MRRDTVPPRMAGGFKVCLVKYVKYWPWSHISSSMFWFQSLNDGVVILGSNVSYEVYDPLYGNPLGTKVLDIVFYLNLIYVFSYFIFLCKKNKRNQDIYGFFFLFYIILCFRCTELSCTEGGSKEKYAVDVN